MSTITATLNGGWAYVSTGHRQNCPAPKKPCVCRKTLLKITGSMALLAGVVGGVVSWISGASFGVADAAHAFADAIADFFGIKITHDIEKLNQQKERVKTHLESVRGLEQQGRLIEKRGSRIIALLLAAAIVPIIIELQLGREYLVPLGMIIAGIIGTVINSLRWHMLSQANKKSPNITLQDLVNHAKADTIHSAYVFSAGWVFEIARFFAITIFFGIELSLNSIWGNYVWSATSENIDILLSMGVIVYILYQAQKIWRGKGHLHSSSNHNDHH